MVVHGQWTRTHAFKVVFGTPTTLDPAVAVPLTKLRLIVEKDPETGRYSSVFPELPGCAWAGDSEDEAIANAREALELWGELTN